ncbi:3D domain-containing protein [Patescibacteria group bacterium]|nr:3D domain-containing protein [Patescibacteria group bacterium]MBU4274200.1 3D domain-containing protein [Patescibacteria group bacterium]MBU4367296.1 3D domain-containing protein [Patescibacteria group bacterium]MBU4461633.1 3D domain-containing protein [Patescibacteria group bacterium]MCG2699683.1 3D domain-containing protein [Candidatus Parcubacteria bacterium]
MYFSLKNTTLRFKKVIFSFLMLAVLAVGGLELTIPKTSEADFLLNNYAYLADLATAQDNTLLSKSNPTESIQIKKKIKMVITAYSSTIAETDSTPFITASGAMVEDGIVANNLLPFGSRIRVPELYGNKIFIVEDRMSLKKGNYHLDIWFSDTGEAKKFGSELAYVEILAN